MDRVFQHKLISLTLVVCVLLLGIPLGAELACMGSSSDLDCCCAPASTAASSCCEEEASDPEPRSDNCACFAVELAVSTGMGGAKQEWLAVAGDEQRRPVHQDAPQIRRGHELPEPRARSGPALYLIAQVFLI